MTRVGYLAVSLVAGLLAFHLSGCGGCKTTFDCEAGEYCDLAEGTCIQGCQSDSDCADSAQCRRDIGRCEPRISVFPPDSGTSTTTVDAGSGDGG
jgi:hypothetical protein